MCWAIKYLKTVVVSSAFSCYFRRISAAITFWASLVNKRFITWRRGKRAVWTRSNSSNYWTGNKAIWFADFLISAIPATGPTHVKIILSSAFNLWLFSPTRGRCNGSKKHDLHDWFIANRTVLVWFSGGTSGSLVEPTVRVFFARRSQPKYPLRDQTSLICRQSGLGSYRTQIRPKLRRYQVNDLISLEIRTVYKVFANYAMNCTDHF